MKTDIVGYILLIFACSGSLASAVLAEIDVQLQGYCLFFTMAMCLAAICFCRPHKT